MNDGGLLILYLKKEVHASSTFISELNDILFAFMRYERDLRRGSASW